MVTLKPGELICNHQIVISTIIVYCRAVSGRSFCDLNQYPVFPWVLTNYEADSLDLTDPKIYRDLSKVKGQFVFFCGQRFKKYIMSHMCDMSLASSIAFK